MRAESPPGISCPYALVRAEESQKALDEESPSPGFMPLSSAEQWNCASVNSGPHGL